MVFEVLNQPVVCLVLGEEINSTHNIAATDRSDPEVPCMKTTLS